MLRSRNYKSVFLLLLEGFEMYYGEKLINGVLHWRETLNGEWEPMSQEKLTDLVIQLRKSLQVATAWGQFHNERLPMLWPPQPVVTCKDSASE